MSNEGRATREVIDRYGVKQEVNTLSDLILDMAFTVTNELAYHITVGGNVANGESANIAPHTLVPASLSGSPSLPLLNNKVTT